MKNIFEILSLSFILSACCPFALFVNASENNKMSDCYNHGMQIPQDVIEKSKYLQSVMQRNPTIKKLGKKNTILTFKNEEDLLWAQKYLEESMKYEPEIWGNCNPRKKGFCVKIPAKDAEEFEGYCQRCGLSCKRKRKQDPNTNFFFYFDDDDDVLFNTVLSSVKDYLKCK